MTGRIICFTRNARTSSDRFRMAMLGTRMVRPTARRICLTDYARPRAQEGLRRCDLSTYPSARASLLRPRTAGLCKHLPPL